ncbi:hypothetical protein TcCL_ESM07009 [Trypanosoma cruzi]|nr:hypothetical protein TcCL_ESM07009 [Trypanosoma cruzi]
MMYIPVMMSPEVAKAPNAAVNSARSSIFPPRRTQPRECLQQPPQCMRERVPEKFSLPTSSPSSTVTVSPATPHMARLLDLSSKFQKCSNDATVGDIHQLLFSHSSCRPAERHSLRLSSYIESGQSTQQHRKESLHGLLKGEKCLVDDENFVKEKDNTALVENDGNSVLFHVKCTNCASDERILIDINTPTVSYCPFCGFPQP